VAASVARARTTDRSAHHAWQGPGTLTTDEGRCSR
jgi:hypothetical protein